MQLTLKPDRTFKPSANCRISQQIRSIDKKRLKERMGRLDDTSMAEIDTALSISFGLGRGGTT